MTLPLKLSAQPAASLATFAPGVQQILQNVIFVGSRPCPVYPDDGVGKRPRSAPRKNGTATIAPTESTLASVYPLASKFLDRKTVRRDSWVSA
jgi:hypothetical protein